MIEEITISVNGRRVVGLLEAEPESVTVEIQSVYKNLKAGLRASNMGLGFHRFVQKGKVSPSAIQDGKEILKGLYLAGRYLQEHPEFIQKLRRYLARFEKQAKAIQRERRELAALHDEGELATKEYQVRMEELRIAENQNVKERGIVFRRYEAELVQLSGGRADSGSIFAFELCE